MPLTLDVYYMYFPKKEDNLYTSYVHDKTIVYKGHENGTRTMVGLKLKPRMEEGKTLHQ